MEIITIANEKGGAGKTSTAAALWYWLNAHGRKALAVDLDPQCNLSYCLGAAGVKPSVFGVLTQETEAAAAIAHTMAGDVIPADKMLAMADRVIAETGKEYRLKEALEPVAADYQYCVVDTAPHLGVLTVNALTAARRVVIPTQADVFSLLGIGQLWENIQTVRKYCNPSLQVDGILLTRYSTRAVLSRQMQETLEQTARQMGTRLYRATIREAIAVKECQLQNVSIFEHGGKVGADYEAFIAELLEERKDGQ